MNDRKLYSLDTDDDTESGFSRAVSVTGWVCSGILVLILVLLLTHIITFAKVEGRSMEPSYFDGDRIVAAGIFGPKRGDVILVLVDGRVLIKRCIGLGGDVIDYDGSQVLVNGTAISEPYLKDAGYHNYGSSWNGKIPGGQMFVLGDNRGDSLDSRVFGCIDVSKYVGTVLFCFPGKGGGA